MIPRFANVPSVDSCHGEIEETEGGTDRNVTMFVDFSIFIGFLNRDIISKWLLRTAAHSLIVYPSTNLYSCLDLSNVDTANPHQLLVRRRTSKGSRDSDWPEAMSVIFNICNNEVYATLTCVLCQRLNLWLGVLRSYNDPSLCFLKTKRLRIIVFYRFISSYVFISLFSNAHGLTRAHDRWMSSLLAPVQSRHWPPGVAPTLQIKPWQTYPLFWLFNGNIEPTNTVLIR